jgi:hypothetical protein
MDFQMIPVAERVEVEGHSDLEAVGDFSGRVIAIAFRGGDPVAEPLSAGADADAAGNDSPVEGLGGFGSTHFLVCDKEHPSPFWVSKDDIQKTSIR